MAGVHGLKYIALGITTYCSHCCGICYETAGLKPKDRRNGDLKTLMHIGDKLLKAGVEFVELVGGDPNEHPEIGKLTRYLHDLGLEVGILSNTHCAWREVAAYVTALEWTVHGPQNFHDAYTRPGTYNEVLGRLKEFAKVKTKDQKIGLTLNFTPIMSVKLYETVCALANELPVNYIQLQRVGPFGGAKGGDYSLKLEEVIAIYRQIQKVDEELGLEIEVVDSYPMCLLPEDLRKYTARCDWGFGTGYVNMCGDLSRCAVNQIYNIGNILVPETPLEWLWEHDAGLRRFREKRYLPLRCQECDLLEKCGGGCPSSCGGCELSVDQLIAERED